VVAGAVEGVVAAVVCAKKVWWRTTPGCVVNAIMLR
jgi:hypothetical protein